MLSTCQSLLIITNLYPVPWANHRASFNKQQFDLIAQKVNVNIIILMPWTEWFKHRKSWKVEANIKVCPYFYLPKIGRRFVPFFQCMSLLCFLPWIKKINPQQLLASWGFPDAVAVSMLNRWLKLPFFVKVHGTDLNENTQYQPRRGLILKWLSHAKTIFCPSKALVNTLTELGIEPEKVCVNYNGVNPAIFFPLIEKPAKKRLVFVGSLIATKGVNELLEAFCRVKEYIEDIELDILGSGPLQQKLEQLIQQNNLTDCARVHGSVPLNDVAGYIRAANLLVLPSYREGVPNVLLESFASGTPVIATKVGGIPEVVTPDVGILIEEKSSKQLEIAIKQALETTWDLEKILTHATQFDWTKNVAMLIQSIEKE